MIPVLEPWQISMLNMLSMVVLVTAAIIALTRNMALAVKTYIVQAGILVLMFLTIGTKYEWFIGWSISAIITKMVIVPWVLLWVINRTKYVAEREEPIIPVGAYLLLIVIAYAVSLVLAEHIASTAYALVRIGIASLATALSLVILGLSIVALARNALKQLMGIILFENGSHILLASMAFYVPETAEIGITSDAVIFITILALLAYRMVRVEGDMDVSKLTILKH